MAAKRLKKARGGQPLSPVEISIISGFYTGDPQFKGICPRVQRAYVKAAKSRKNVRKTISIPTIRKVVREQNLEDARLKNLATIREKNRLNGLDMLDNNIELVKKMKAIVVQRLIGVKGQDVVMPTWSDLGNIIKLESHVKGNDGNDGDETKKPDLGVTVINNIGIDLSGKSNEQLQRGLDRLMAAQSGLN